MRWLIAYTAALIVTLALLLAFLSYGIGGCDCGLEDTGLFCWLCNNQLVYLAFATAPLWLTALAHLRANLRRHKRELYGDDYYDRQPRCRGWWGAPVAPASRQPSPSPCKTNGSKTPR